VSFGTPVQNGKKTLTNKSSLQVTPILEMTHANTFIEKWTKLGKIAPRFGITKNLILGNAFFFFWIHNSPSKSKMPFEVEKNPSKLH
jgi:hypothetical protein